PDAPVTWCRSTATRPRRSGRGPRRAPSSASSSRSARPQHIEDLISRQVDVTVRSDAIHPDNASLDEFARYGSGPFDDLGCVCERTGLDATLHVIGCHSTSAHRRVSPAARQTATTPTRGVGRVFLLIGPDSSLFYMSLRQLTPTSSDR